MCFGLITSQFRYCEEQGLEVEALEAMTDALEALQGETFEVSEAQINIDI